MRADPQQRPDFSVWFSYLKDLKQNDKRGLMNKISGEKLTKLGVRLDFLDNSEMYDIVMNSINDYFNFEPKTSKVNIKWWPWSKAKSVNNSMNSINNFSKAISKSNVIFLE